MLIPLRKDTFEVDSHFYLIGPNHCFALSVSGHRLWTVNQNFAE